MRTRTRPRPSRLLTATLAAGLLLAACGGDDGDADAAADDALSTATEAADDSTGEMTDGEMSEGEMGDMSEGDMEEMSEGEMEMDEMSEMDMGSADATPADEVGGELTQGDFTVLDSAPNGLGFQEATGTAYLARTDDGTVATLEVEGLRPDTAFVSHVHAEACSNEGGPHYRFDEDGSDMPPNEIHLNFTTDADGAATWTATNEMVAGEEAQSMVVHARDEDTTKALCADLSA